MAHFGCGTLGLKSPFVFLETLRHLTSGGGSRAPEKINGKQLLGSYLLPQNIEYG